MKKIILLSIMILLVGCLQNTNEPTTTINSFSECNEQIDPFVSTRTITLREHERRSLPELTSSYHHFVYRITNLNITNVYIEYDCLQKCPNNNCEYKFDKCRENAFDCFSTEKDTLKNNCEKEIIVEYSANGVICI